MSVTTISLGTAGTQSGDKVRDAFNIVNQNFQNFQLSDLKGYYKYSEMDGFWDYISATWSYTSAILSSIPAGTYMLLLSAQMFSGDGGGASQPVMGITDGNNVDLGIQFVGSADDSELRNYMAMVQVIKAASFSIKLRFKCLNYNEGSGAHFPNVSLLLFKVA